MKSVIITDCGSTTTKGIWFEISSDGIWRMKARAEAPTTVEKPVADVTKGVIGALSALGCMASEEVVKTSNNVEILNTGPSGSFDLYLSTSSAGGGLQMVVLGIVSSISGASAERAALGAGALVLDKVTLDDGRLPHEQAHDVRQSRPDIILLTGGVDGGATDQIRALVEVLLLSEPRSRFDSELKIPVLYAGNSEIADEVLEILNTSYDAKKVPNLRPKIDLENVVPAREAIHDLFLEHVMSQAPGYSALQDLVDREIMPTPAAVSRMIEVASNSLSSSIVAVDIGGATTDIFSVRRGEEGFKPVHRTVSANLGMSYSIGNVLDTAGVDNILRWIPWSIDADIVRACVWNKMVRPTTIPETIEELYIEHAVAREALSHSFLHHQELDLDLQGLSQNNDVAKMFVRQAEQSFNMFEIDMIIGSGGVLSHAPYRGQTAMMMLDSFRPLGATFLGVDSVFMMPHLGVLSVEDEAAAVSLLFSECIFALGTSITPRLEGKAPQIGKPLFKIERTGSSVLVNYGELKVESCETGLDEEIRLVPLSSGVNLGAGAGKLMDVSVKGGSLGIILDARVDCLAKNCSDLDRAKLQNQWMNALSIPLPGERS